tara:strand:- start:959 stop:1621 length:663 start_codon:yes stop_codon:yes gene_type:complete
MEESLSVITKKEIKLVGAGRTDTGVHAKIMVAHFDFEYELVNKNKLIILLNKFHGNDLFISDIKEVKINAHARFSALSRTYEYYISFVKNPFNYDFEYFVPVKPDLTMMKKATRILTKFNDFESFSKKGSDVNNFLCEIYNANWNEVENGLLFTIEANRFLRNMVRSIVGTILNVGQKKTHLNEFIEIIKSKKRSNAGFSVPPNALFLKNIKYHKSIFIK